ncbi:MAG: hypothetical protein ABI556_09830 [Gemmatimonadales bacterium]
MTSAPIVDQVSVSIVSAAVSTHPPGWHIEYEVRNNGTQTVWLVVDERLVFRRDNDHVELSYARARMQPGVQVFGYFEPKATELSPGESARQSVDITWPLTLSDIWNANREVAPAPGVYDVTVRIGFGLTPAPESPTSGETVEEPVLRWQREAVSPHVQLEIPLDQRPVEE